MKLCYAAFSAVETPGEHFSHALQDLANLIDELEAETPSAAFAAAADARARRWVPRPPWETGLTNGVAAMSTSGPSRTASTGAATAPEPMSTVSEEMDVGY